MYFNITGQEPFILWQRVGVQCKIKVLQIDSIVLCESIAVRLSGDPNNFVSTSQSSWLYDAWQSVLVLFRVLQ